MTVSRVASLLLCLLIPVASARAQSAEDPSDHAQFRFGALRFSPFIVVKDVGVDTNVYNQADSEDPKQDATATFGPGLEYWLHFGAAHLAAKSDVTYTWFQTYADQRSTNTDNIATLTFFPYNRVSPFVDGLYLYGRVRPGFEIDSRSFRTDYGYGGGADIHATGKSTFRVEGHSRTLAFRDDQVFDGANLSQELNRTSTSAAVSFREDVTPLTTFVVKSEYQQDRFEFSPFRDANAWAVVPGLEFDPLALISGKVFVGYRHFDTLDASIPDYSGLVANVEASYHVHATQFAVKVARDVTYSYEQTQPYYVLTDIGLTVTQKITAHWDVTADGSRQWLGYRDVQGSAAVSGDRVDRSYRVGGGTGYTFSDSVRAGILVEYYHRASNELDLRNYNGLRMGGTFTVGLSK